jgi:transcriptional regulator NrdR family protein
MMTSVPGRPKPKCSRCGDGATQVVELRTSTLPTGKTRGTYIRSVERRLCDGCAGKFVTVLASGPRRVDDNPTNVRNLSQ